ncbi:predicted protein [Arabidopsis lyrata subsp. lyrata]|uniref:Predicted protein n=1 Tax=Arabidopsis lyrata subsp. lyrata TaxID=81972 RepID=D7KMC2_ARALL|nr:predicted protein [Arabidopsis lyrata subsp. lyrata]
MFKDPFKDSTIVVALKPQSSVDQVGAKTMLKRHRSRENQTKKRLCLSLEFLPHDLVELILQRLPVKPLLRFKSVSKNWKSTIESQRFQEGNLICSRQALGPDVLLMSLCEKGDAGLSGHARTVMFSLATASKVRFPFSGSMFCYGHCDGLVCFYCVYAPSFVMNPATKWHRSFPLSGYQQLVIERYNRLYFKFISFKLGLGRDKFRGIYKAVWLYSSSEYGLDNVTTCELFDFSTNAWRKPEFALLPIAVREKKWLLLQGRDFLDPVVIYNLHSKSYRLFYKPREPVGPVYYLQSLFSA